MPGLDLPRRGCYRRRLKKVRVYKYLPARRCACPDVISSAMKVDRCVGDASSPMSLALVTKCIAKMGCRDLWETYFSC
jgi:hypothetical protein